MLGVVLLLTITSLVTGTVHRVAAQQLPTSSTDNTDPELRAEVDQAMSRELHGTQHSLISVEVLTVDNASVERAVNRLGGTVTGSVDGQLVQAFMPAAGVEALSAIDASRYVQRPLRVNRLPPTEAVGFGATVGDEVALTNAGAWHDAGITGNVRVGIIDFFDLTLWNPAEQGTAPDAAHQFCPDLVNDLCTPTGQINSAKGDRHGVAVAEIVKDMAPGAELFLATTATTAETQAAIDWFVANGVHIVTRSLGAPYDGPGDGTGPLDAVVDYAAARGVTWFNSGGNDAASGYGRYTDGVDANGYVDFQNGPGVDTVLRIDPSQGGVALDGIRWANDWYLPTAQVTDYSVEVSVGVSETSRTVLATLDNSQVGGAPPLEAVDLGVSVGLGQSLFLRIHANAHYSPAQPDTVEVATFFGSIESRSAVDPVQLGQTCCRLAQPIAVGGGRHRPGQRLHRHRLLLIAGPHQRRADQARHLGTVVREEHDLPDRVLQRHQRGVAGCRRHGSPAARPGPGRGRNAAGRTDPTSRPRSRRARARQRLRGGRDPAAGRPGCRVLCSQHVQRPGSTGSPSRHPSVVVRRSAQPRRPVPPIRDRRSTHLDLGRDPPDRNRRRRQRHLDGRGNAVLRAGPANPRR